MASKQHEELDLSPEEEADLEAAWAAMEKQPSKQAPPPPVPKQPPLKSKQGT